MRNVNVDAVVSCPAKVRLNISAISSASESRVLGSLDAFALTLFREERVSTPTQIGTTRMSVLLTEETHDVLAIDRLLDVELRALLP